MHNYHTQQRVVLTSGTATDYKQKHQRRILSFQDQTTQTKEERYPPRFLRWWHALIVRSSKLPPGSCLHQRNTQLRNKIGYIRPCRENVQLRERGKNTKYLIFLTDGILKLLQAETNCPHQRYAQNESVFPKMKAEAHEQRSLQFTRNKRRYQIHICNVENQSAPDPPFTE